MGAKTAFSANEAADGIAELEKAGVSTADIMNGGLSGALNLATAGEVSVADAAEIASTAMNAFKNDNLTVTDAANQMAGAANASATDVHELQYGLSAVSAVASGVGLSFNDTTNALAVFAQNGLKGSDAGTSLKTMLQNLSPSTKSATAEMEKLGIITKDGSNKFFDAKGNIKSMSSVAEILKSSLGGLTKQQQQVALKTMFGTDAVRAGTIAAKEGAKGFDSMQKSISKVSAADVAKEKLNNLKGALEELKGSLETAGISIGSKFLPSLTGLVKGITNIVNGFNKLPEGAKTAVVGTVGAFGALAGVGATLGVVLGAVGKYQKAMGTLLEVAANAGKMKVPMTIAAKAVHLLTSPIKLLSTVAGLASKAFVGLTTAMVANPITAIVVAIAAVVAALVLFLLRLKLVKKFGLIL